ncbi:MAG: GerAB/ArcD/ProY family transporter [Bacillota bacterium]
MHRVHIGQWQLVAILACLAFGKSIGFTAGALTRMVSSDAWLSMSFAFLLAFVLILPSVWLARRFPTEQPRQYFPRVLGRPLGMLCLILLALFFFGSYIFSAITIELHVNDFLMTETPTLVFVVAYSLLCLYGAYLGLETAARLAFPGFLMSAAIGILMVAGTIDHFEGERLRPFFDHGVGPVLWGSTIALTDTAMVTAGALVIFPLAGQPHRWLRIALWGLLGGALIVLVWPIFEIAVLGPEVTAQYLIACMQLARAAELSVYLHRYEMVMMVFFAWGVLTQSIVCLYTATEMLGAALPFRVSRGWFMTICVLIILPIHYQITIDRELTDVIMHQVWPVLSLPVALGLPPLIWLVSLLRPNLPRSESAS